MHKKRLLLLTFITCFLANCAGMNRITGNPPSSVDPHPTLTPFFPVGATSTPPFAPFTSTPSSTFTITPTLSPTPSRRVNLQAVGDIMLARQVGNLVTEQGPGIVFAGVQTEFNSADVLVGNLECAITTWAVPESKSYTFAAPPEAATSLAMAGFDVLSLANNHAMDFGLQGLADTRNVLDMNGIASIGVGADDIEAHTPLILERNGLRMAFLAYVDVPEENSGFDTRSWTAGVSAPGVAWADVERIETDVSNARLLADVVIVLLHSGYEGNTAVSLNQRAEARAAIDSGAALVIGSHSHILQRLELYHGGLITYSLANFVFDDYKGDYNATVILRVVLTPSGLESYEFVPVLIENGLPSLTQLAEAPWIENMLEPLAP